VAAVIKSDGEQSQGQAAWQGFSSLYSHFSSPVVSWTSERKCVLFILNIHLNDPKYTNRFEYLMCFGGKIYVTLLQY